MSLAIAGELDAARFARTCRELEEGIRGGLQHGGQICLELRGETVVDAAFGEVRPGEAMRREHRMLWMSSSKPMAAIAVAKLWENGGLRLDDPVALHVPEFAAGGKERVTIRHLLTHTGGVRMLDTGWPALDWDAVLAKVCAQRLEPNWEPGRKAGYHLASSWFVLGEIVRRVDGRPFDRWIREELFEPLGARSCWVGMPESELAERGDLVAPMFDAAGGSLLENRSTQGRRLTVCSPGGNGCGPVAELARVYRMLASGGESILRPQTVEALTARHRVGMVDVTFRTRLDWGLGFIVNSAHYADPAMPYGYGPHAGPRAWGHSGARSSTAFHDPDASLTVALAVNGMPGDEVHRARFERLLRAIYEDLGLGR